VDAPGDVAKREETLSRKGSSERSSRKEWRRNFEEDSGHERMNPIRKKRGTVGWQHLVGYGNRLRRGL
jgi:hypothetical protein